MSEIVRTQEEIDDVLNECVEIENNEGSRFHGMSYEQGLQDMYAWLVGESNDNPLEL